MKYTTSFFIAAVAILASLQVVLGFAPVSPASTSVSSSSVASSTRLNFFGAAKDDGSPGDYLCPVSSILDVFLFRFTVHTNDCLFCWKSMTNG